MAKYDHIEYIYEMDKYFRLSNYLGLGQIYLYHNSLLRNRLSKDDIKPRLVGHWGTVPSQNFIYTHLNRVINKYDLDVLLISGPGHGGNFMRGQSYIEGVYRELYPEYKETEEGLNKFFKDFSFPYGTSSHVAPEIPGSIHEGGELGYSLFHGMGAIIDHKNLIAAVIVGDGEAETGPLSSAWKINNFINPSTDGTVLPIINLNGYKIANPSMMSRMTDTELKEYFEGNGWSPLLVESDVTLDLHKKMAMALDSAISRIMAIKEGADLKFPVIILKTKKGWTGPAYVHGKKVEGSFRAHQVPISVDTEEDLRSLEDWLKSYKIEELINEDGSIKDDIKALIPRKGKRISESIYAHQGMKKKLILPDFAGFNITRRGEALASDMTVLGDYLKGVILNNKDNFIMLSPDENNSNRLSHLFEVTKRKFTGPIYEDDEDLGPNGRVYDSLLNEHFCEGVLEGYVLTGRHGMFSSYEAFLRVVDSMITQHLKWIKKADAVPFRGKPASLNLIATSYCWQQDHNGYTHQDPGIIGHLLSKDKKYLGLYFPVDANTLVETARKALASQNKINLIIGSKHDRPQWFSKEEAESLVARGYSLNDFASINPDNPDIVMASIGSEANLESLAAIQILHKYMPRLNIRYINIIDLLKIAPSSEGGMSDAAFDLLFTKDKPIIINYHGFTSDIYSLLYNRHNKNIKVNGYMEEGSITTPFDMRVQNKVDRFHIVKDVIEKVSGPVSLSQKMDALLYKHTAYIKEYGVDIDEVLNFKWEDINA